MAVTIDAALPTLRGAASQRTSMHPAGMCAFIGPRWCGQRRMAFRDHRRLFNNPASLMLRARTHTSFIRRDDAVGHGAGTRRLFWSYMRCRLKYLPLPAHYRRIADPRIGDDARWAISATLAATLDVVARRAVSGWSVRVGVVAPTAAAQRAALVELYIATNGSTWSSGGNTGWLNHGTGSDPCDDSWRGVTCSGSAGAMNRNV